MVSVKYEDLTEAFDFVSFGGPFEHSAYISLDTGTIYWDTDSGEEELPDDLGESNRYVAVPHKNDLDLGRNLVLRFVASELPDQYATVEGFFRHRGAYARLKELLGSEGCLEAWYAFEAAETSTALRNWCRENDIQIVEDRGDSPA
jgi:hypothetical protein